MIVRLLLVCVWVRWWLLICYLCCVMVVWLWKSNDGLRFVVGVCFVVCLLMCVCGFGVVLVVV